MSEHTPTAEELLDPARLRESYPEYDDQVEYTQTVPEQEGEYVPAERVLPTALAEALGTDLYSHQAEALRLLLDGRNVTVGTATASGKTWIYALYFALLKRQNPAARAVFVYPTKALSGDQEEAINDLFDRLGVDATAERYDGDTPSDRRPLIRDRADVLITNFAGINVYLDSHTKWRSLFRNCELLVVDESHTYTGIHGMHVAWTIRRLRRLLAAYGGDPQLVCSSATIGNPAAHSKRLTGAEFAVVDGDGSPRGRREIVFWQPAIEDGDAQSVPDDGGGHPELRRGANGEAASVAAHLGLNGVQTLAFTRSRQGTEISAKQAINAAGKHPAEGYLDVDPYHAGLSKEKRRAIEFALKESDVDVVFSTNALELGIDIGSVDATVLAGYPGTRQSFWQQVGRAGRGRSAALSVFVPRGDAIDQYILDNPGYLLASDVEDAVVDLENDPVYARHLLCASAEQPLTWSDAAWFGPENRLARAVEMWRDAGQIVGDLDRGAQYDGPPRPQADISMYAATDEQYDVRCTNGDIDMEPLGKDRVYREYHPGALTLYDGQQYEVVDVVEDTRRPYVELRAVSTREYTRTLSDKQISNIESHRHIDLGDGYALHAGMGTVDVAYHSFKRIDLDSGQPVGPPQATGLEPISLRTQLMWVELPEEILDRVCAQIPAGSMLASPEESPLGEREWTVAGGLHGAEHGTIKLAPLELRLDTSDMGGLSTLAHPELQSPGWFVHDAVEGGVGFAHSIYDSFEAVASKTRQRVDGCQCERDDGCPACLMSSQCGNENEPLHRHATTAVLDAVLERL